MRNLRLQKISDKPPGLVRRRFIARPELTRLTRGVRAPREENKAVSSKEASHTTSTTARRSINGQHSEVSPDIHSYSCCTRRSHSCSTEPVA
ncbi:hypothetical protein Trydic_g17006 [Trypoxylus dichotomus]